MSLDRSEILVHAMAILDDYGLADLTMRRLAESLGVKAGAIYWHYANKQTLLAAISDVIIEGVGAPEDGGWDTRLGVWAAGLRAALLRHRDAADLVSSTRATGLGCVDPVIVPTQILVSAGWSVSVAGRAARALVHFILGHVFEEQSRVALVQLGVLDASRGALDDIGFTEGIALFLAGLENRSPAS